MKTRKLNVHVCVLSTNHYFWLKTTSNTRTKLGSKAKKTMMTECVLQMLCKVPAIHRPIDNKLTNKLFHNQWQKAIKNIFTPHCISNLRLVNFWDGILS